MRLTPRGQGAVALGVTCLLVGVLLGQSAAVVLGSAALVAVVIAAAAVIEPPPARVTRSAFPTVVDRNDPSQVTLVFSTASRRRPRPFNVIETVDGALRSAEVSPIGIAEACSITYDVDTSRRGVVIAGPVLLRRTDPFGLVVADRRVGGTCTVTVHPKRFPVKLLPQGRLRDLEGPTREVAQGSATFHQMREYAPGDDLRHIHWRSSARQGKWMVKHLVDTTRPEMVVVVDNRAATIGEHDFEEVAEVAASVLASAERAGFPAQLLFTDGDTGQDPNGTPMPYLDRLTVARLSDTDSLLDIADALRARGRSLVVIGGEPSPSDLAVLARLARGFSPAYLVSVVADRRAPLVAPPGMIGVPCSSAAAFAASWSLR